MTPIPFLAMISLLACTSIVIGILAALLLFRAFFKDWADFVECLRLSLKANMSMVRGDWSGYWSWAKVAVWIVSSFILGSVAYAELPNWLPGIFHR